MSFSGRAQNLILNPSFELVDTSYAQASIILDAAYYWKSINSADLLTPIHYNGFLDNWGAPNSAYGYQYQKFGNNYALQGTLINWFSGREFCSQTFSAELDSGAIYCVSLYAAACDMQTYYTDCLEAYLSIGAPDTNGTDGYLFDHIPQIDFLSNTIFTDTSEWHKISASFTAMGGENTITIGCFTHDDGVNILVNSPHWEYGSGYFIDAVSLYRCDEPVFEADAGADTNICIGQSVVLGTHNMPQYEYLWLSEDGDTLSHEAFFAVQPTTTTTYTLQVTDFKFDITTDDITVRVDECNFPLYVANIFSPNADGNNDLLCVRGRQISGLEEFRVFNRWGEEVYTCHTSTPLSVTPEDCCWDGNIAGEEAPAGVYTWYAKAIMLSGQTVTGHGNVTLVR